MKEYGVKLSDKGLLIELVERKDGESVLNFCYRVIGCDTIDIVNPKGLEQPYCMVVDDEGLLKDKPMLNVFASHLYGAYEYGHAIVGNAVLMKNERDVDGMQTVWLTKDEAASLAAKLGNSVLRAVADLNSAIRKGVL